MNNEHSPVPEKEVSNTDTAIGDDASSVQSVQLWASRSFSEIKFVFNEDLSQREIEALTCALLMTLEE